MTKNLLMNYTFYSLFVIAFLSYIAFGLQSFVLSIITVGVAVLCDILLSKVMGAKGTSNLMSAATFGLIVALSYSLGETTGAGMFTEKIPAISGELDTYLFAALISAVGLIVFKKIQGLLGRKYVNPAATAKLLVLGLLLLLPILSYSTLLPTSHSDANAINLQNPWTPDAFGGPDFQPIDTDKFAFTLLACYAEDPLSVPYVIMEVSDPLPDVLNVMLVAKYHGWVGGFSSILVIAVGIVLIALSHGYFKWRITLAYLVGTAVLSVLMGFLYGGDIILRLLFHLFMGSSIFMAFFMATDPATTPITRTGQLIFGTGLAILTMIIQVYTGFLGGSILALVVMNLTCPILDRVGLSKGRAEKTVCAIPPKAKKFESVEVTECIRCGQCLLVCSNRLPTIAIKEASEKGDWKRVKALGAEYCKQCGTCSFVCPARIDLKGAMLIAREKVKNMQA